MRMTMFRQHAPIVFHHRNPAFRILHNYTRVNYISKRSISPSATRSLDLPPLTFEIWSEPPIFPDILGSSTPSLVIGIDPDVNGALATFRWANTTSFPFQTLPLPHTNIVDMLSTAHVDIYDMPTETWKMKSREKNYPSPQGLLSLLQSLLEKESATTTTIHAMLEFTTPTHLSGKFAWYGSGFASGLLTGLFLSQNIPCSRIGPAVWKKEMGLRKLGKEGSLALARQLFPHIAPRYLKRKKDHGRAEALLITAWAIGVRASARVEDDSSLPLIYNTSTEEEDDDDEEDEDEDNSEGS